jgi:cytoplasmic iron level regulating protein YaaA (DUF328/UPF0246 family)
MLVLLPPSEGKAAPVRGRPVDLAKLSLPALHAAREGVLDALVALTGRDEAAACAALGIGAGQLAPNRRLREAPAVPAQQLYTGVLYEALDIGSLGPDAVRLLRRSVLIFSGLWGVVRLTDRIPPYRCAMTARLPGIGGLGAYWRRALDAPLAELAGRGLVLDLRSSAYATAWTPASRCVTVRVLHERTVNGTVTRSVVSHFNKATKGRLVRDLAMAGAAPRKPAELVTALRDLKYTVDEPGPGQVDVVVTDL